MALLDLRALVEIPTGTGAMAMTTEARRNLERWAPIFTEVGREKGIAPAFLAAVSKRESDPQWSADSENPNSGAKGLMQLMPSNVEAFDLTGGRWKNPVANVRAGADILLQMGYGERHVGRVLMGYGGFRGEVRGERDDPAPYIEYILIAYAGLWLQEGLSPVPTW